MWRERRGEGEKEEVEACDIANVDEVVKGCVREGDGDASCREGMEAAEAGRQGEEGGNAVDWGAEDVARENHGECEGWLLLAHEIPRCFFRRRLGCEICMESSCGVRRIRHNGGGNGVPVRLVQRGADWLVVEPNRGQGGSQS